jgi:hypothetical protein
MAEGTKFIANDGKFACGSWDNGCDIIVAGKNLQIDVYRLEREAVL